MGAGSLLEKVSSKAVTLHESPLLNDNDTGARQYF